MQLGDGCELVLMADILLAVPNTNFRKPEVNIGTIMGGGSLQQLMLTGHMRSAQEAAARGMASRIVRGDSTFITRGDFARWEIAGKSRIVVQEQEAVNAGMFGLLVLPNPGIRDDDSFVCFGVSFSLVNSA